MIDERLAQLNAARERSYKPYDTAPPATAPTEPVPPRTEAEITLGAARVWLSAETRNPNVLTAIMARRVLLALDQDTALGAEAALWLGKQCVRSDYLHRKWAQCVYRTLEERDDNGR